jgi:methylated-DNA-[protein]-cysteine S-methyltransferase
MKTLHLYVDHLETPIGEVVLVSDAEGRLRIVHFTDREERWRSYLARQYGPNLLFSQANDAHGFTSAFAAYFEGDCSAIDCLPVETSGTPFQQTVWRSLRSIPAGETWSYRQLAEYVGQPKAVRAVGAANGANPVGIVLPCHRVIGANGALTGYGGGLTRKQWLLEHERRYLMHKTDPSEFTLQMS